MKTRIFITASEKKTLLYEFGVSTATISRALNGFDGSAMAKLIRKRAIDMGGVQRVINSNTEEK
ncbi:MAG: hypothetical protein ACRC6R_10255 [Bacteroidales bacterium]